MTANDLIWAIQDVYHITGDIDEIEEGNYNYGSD